MLVWHKFRNLNTHIGHFAINSREGGDHSGLQTTLDPFTHSYWVWGPAHLEIWKAPLISIFRKFCSGLSNDAHSAERNIFIDVSLRLHCPYLLIDMYTCDFQTNHICTKKSVCSYGCNNHPFRLPATRNLAQITISSDFVLVQISLCHPRRTVVHYNFCVQDQIIPDMYCLIWMKQHWIWGTRVQPFGRATLRFLLSSTRAGQE